MNTESTFGGNVWEGLEVMVIIGGGIYLRVDFEVSNGWFYSKSILSLLFGDQDVGSPLFLLQCSTIMDSKPFKP